MKIWVVSHHDKKAIENDAREAGAVLDEKTPEFVLTYGGDGTILDAERKYPGVPKVPVKRSHVYSRCRVYSANEVREVLDKIRAGSYKIKEETKVEADFNGKRVVGLNEVQIRNKYPNKALRFSINESKEEFIGDGVVVATPYGSSAYYKALGYKPFKSGIRLGFNNIMSRHESIEVTEVRIKIIREAGLLLADNDSSTIELKPGDVVTVRKSSSAARFVEV